MTALIFIGPGVALFFLFWSAFATRGRRGGSWWVVARIGYEVGPFHTRAEAEAYPASAWGQLADGPAWRAGWRVEDRAVSDAG